MYRIPDGSNQGIYVVKTQINKTGNKVKLAKTCRKEVLKDLTMFIEN